MQHLTLTIHLENLHITNILSAQNLVLSYNLQWPFQQGEVTFL